MKKTNDMVTTPVENQNKWRYVCHGCTHNAGFFPTPVLNARITCPRCHMDQLTKLENFIEA